MSKIFNVLSKILISLIALFAVLFSSCSFFKFKTSCGLLGLSTYREVSSGVGVVIEDGSDVTTGELKLFENLEKGSDFISLKVPINLDGSISYTLPVEAGRKDYVLTWQEGNIMQWKDINSVALGGTGELIQVVEKSDDTSENPKQNTVTSNTSQTDGSATCTNLICTAAKPNIALDSEVTGILSLINGGIGASLEDPGEDRILFWDESAGKVRWLKIGDNLDIDDRTLNAENSGGDDDDDPVVIVPPSTGYTGEIYTAGNGLYVSGSEVMLGGALNENTTLSLGAYDMVYNLNGIGDFDIQNNGVPTFFINDSGYIGVGTTNPQYSLDVLGTIRAQNFLTSGGMPVNDILLEQEVRNLSITAMTGSLGLDMAQFVEKKSATTFNSASTSSVSSATLTNGNVLIAYRDLGDSNLGKFVIYDNAGNLVKGPAVFNNAFTGWVATATLTNDNFLIAYTDWGNYEEGYFVIYDSAGNLVKSATVFNNQTTYNNSVTTLTNGNVLIAYTNGYSKSAFVIYDSAGNLVKSATTFNSADTSGVSSATLTNGNVLITYNDIGGYGKFVIYDSLGNLVKAETTFNAGATALPFATTLTNGNILIAYRDDGSSSYGKFVIYDSVGNLVQSATTFNSASTNELSSTTLTNGNVLIIYRDSGGYGKFVIYDSVGNLVQSATTFNSASTNELSSTTLTNGNVLIAYTNAYSNGKFVIWGSSGASFANMVGIGTTNPTSRLEIVGSGSDALTSSLWIKNALGDTGLFVNDLGYVGIGTTAPDYELDVLGTIQAYNFINSAGMPVNDILLEEEVRNLSITAMTGSLGLDMTSSFVEKAAEATFNSGSSLSPSVTTFKNGNVLIAYIEGSGSSYGNFVIRRPNGDSYISEMTFNADITSEISVTALTDGNLLIAYKDYDGSFGNFVIYDPHTKLVKTATPFNLGNTVDISATTLTNGNVLIAYTDVTDSNNGNFVIYDSAGNLVKTETTFNSGVTYETSVTTLTNGNVLIVYRDASSSSWGRYVIYDSVGNLVKTEGTFNSSATYEPSVTTLTNGNVLIAYRDSIGNYGSFVIYDSAGNPVKTEITFNMSGTYLPSATTLTNGNVLIAYRDSGDSNNGNFVIYDSAGNLVVAETTFNSGATYEPSATTLTNGNILIAYRDAGDSNNGNFVIYGSSGASFANMVGIGTTAPTASLHVAGTLRFSNFGAGSLITDSSGNVSVSSDERLKDIQGSFDRGLEEILQIDPILYKWNDASGMEKETTYAGLNAQNVQSVIPEAVGIDPNGYLTLSDRPIIATTINAIKEQQDQIEELKSLIIGEGKILELSQSSSSLDIPKTDTGILTQIQTLFIEFKEMILTLGMTTHTDELGNNYLSIDSDVKMAGNLNVLGDTTTSNLTITGNVQMGLITVNTEENSIDVLGVSCYNEGTGEESEYCSDTMNDPSLSTLYLQKSSFGNLDIFNGKLVIEPNGTMKLDGNLEVSGSVNSKSVDTETVSTEKIILKNSSNENSETPSVEEVPEPQAEESLDLSEPCEKGEIKWDDNNIYVCTSSEKWRASPLNDIE